MATEPAAWPDTEVQRFVHRVEHLRCRKGANPYPEATLVVDQCWGLFEPVPDWALDLAASGAPGSVWCPIIDPSLRERARAEAAAAP